MFYKKLLENYFDLPDFTQNVLFVFFTQIIIVISGVISNVLLARYLGPEGQGIVYLIILIPHMIFTLGSLGISSSTIYFTGQKKYSNSQIIANSLFMVIIISVFAGILYFGFLGFLNKTFFKNIEVKFLVMAFLIFPVILITAYISGVPQGLQQIKQVSTINIVQTLTKLILIVVLVAVFRMSMGGAVLAIILSYLSGLIFTLFIVLKIASIKVFVSYEIIKDLLGYGIKSHFGNMIQFLNYRLDVFLINLFLAPFSVGIYSVSVLIAELIWYIPGAVSQVLFPKIAYSETKTANEITPQICRITFFATLCLAVCLVIVSQPVILMFFGKEYLSSTEPLKMLLPGIIALSIVKVLSADLAGRGKPLYATYTALISLIVTVVSNLLLIPRLGVMGAALSSTIAYTVSLIVLSLIYSKISGNKIRSFIVMQSKDFIIYRNLMNGIFKNKDA